MPLSLRLLGVWILSLTLGLVSTAAVWAAPYQRVAIEANIIANTAAAGTAIEDAPRPVLSAGLEPFPPLINEDGTGLSVTWLRALAAAAGYRLQVELMPYSRGQLALRTGQIDLLGHVPLGRETERFYLTAAELDWFVPTKLDVFALRPEMLAADRLAQLRIGTPHGNSAFISLLTGIPEANFYEASLEQCVRMLQQGRVGALIFERASVMTQLQNAGFDAPVYYRLVEEIPAGFAVHRSRSGLQRDLNAAVDEAAHTAIFHAYGEFLALPDHGRVPGLEDREPLGESAKRLLP